MPDRNTQQHCSDKPGTISARRTASWYHVGGQGYGRAAQHNPAKHSAHWLIQRGPCGLIGGERGDNEFARHRLA